MQLHLGFALGPLESSLLWWIYWELLSFCAVASGGKMVLESVLVADPEISP